MTRPQKTEAAKKRSLTLARHFTGYFTSSPFWSYHPSICCHLFAQCSDWSPFSAQNRAPTSYAFSNHSSFHTDPSGPVRTLVLGTPDPPLYFPTEAAGSASFQWSGKRIAAGERARPTKTVNTCCCLVSISERLTRRWYRYINYVAVCVCQCRSSVSCSFWPTCSFLFTGLLSLVSLWSLSNGRIFFRKVCGRSVRCVLRWWQPLMTLAGQKKKKKNKSWRTNPRLDCPRY